MLNKYLNRFKRNKYLTALFAKKKISLRKKYFLISQNFLKVYFSSLGASNGTALYEKSLFLYKKFMFKLTDSNYISSFIRLLSRKSRVKNIFNLLYLQKYIYNFFSKELTILQDIKDTYERKFKIKNRSNIFFNLNRIVSGKDYSFDDDVASSKAKLIGKLAEETAQKYFKDDSDLLNKKKK